MVRPVLALALGVVAPGGPPTTVPGCGAPPDSAVDLAPSSADWIVGMDATVLATAVWSDIGGIVALDRDGARWLTAWDRCLADGSPAAVTVAGDDLSWAWTVRGDKIATDDRVECLTRWLSGTSRSPIAWTDGPSYAGECIRSRVREDGVVALSLENHTLVVVSARWADGVVARLQGRGAVAVDLAEATRLVDPDAAGRLFAAGTLHRANVPHAEGGWRSTVRNLALTVRVSDAGLAARVDVETTDLADGLLAAFTAFAPELAVRLATLGVPADTFERVRVQRRAGVLSWTWAATRSQLAALARGVGERWRGGAL